MPRNVPDPAPHEGDDRDAPDLRDLVGGGLDKVRDAASFLAVSVSQIYALMEQGHLPFVKIGKSRRIPHKAVVDLAVRGIVRRAE